MALCDDSCLFRRLGGGLAHDSTKHNPYDYLKHVVNVHGFGANIYPTAYRIEVKIQGVDIDDW
jgi:hypothetical protein